MCCQSATWFSFKGSENSNIQFILHLEYSRLFYIPVMSCLFGGRTSMRVATIAENSKFNASANISIYVNMLVWIKNLSRKKSRLDNVFF